MIRERPGEKNDRENVISNIDNDRWGTDLEKYRENYDKINWSDTYTTEELRLKPNDFNWSNDNEFIDLLGNDIDNVIENIKNLDK